MRTHRSKALVSRSLSLLLLGVVMVLLQPASAHASVVAGHTKIIAIRSNLCLDSNSSGKAYTLKCNGGGNQNWHSSSSQPYALIDDATGLCLAIQETSGIYTFKCNKKSEQQWTFTGTDIGTFKSRYTGECLASNSSGKVYGAVCSGAGGETGWRGPGVGGA